MGQKMFIIPKYGICFPTIVLVIVAIDLLLTCDECNYPAAVVVYVFAPFIY